MKKDEEYSVAIEADRAFALTMNFPQYRPTNSIVEETKPNESDFNYQCSDCMADLFGPIVAPYAILREQCEDYRNQLKIITETRLRTLKENLFNKKKRLATKPFRYDVKRFFSSTVMMIRFLTMLISPFLFILALIFIILIGIYIWMNDDGHVLLVFVRTLSKFYSNFFFQGIITYGILYSCLHLMSSLSAYFSVYLNSFSLTITASIIVLFSSMVSIISPLFFFIYRSLFWTQLEKHIRTSLNDFDDRTTNPISHFWNNLQTRYSCCGVNVSIDDYRLSYFHQLTGLDIPSSCCQTGSNCSSTPTTNTAHLDISCLPELESSFNTILLVLCLTELLISIVLLILLVLLLVYLRALPRAKRSLVQHNRRILQSIFSALHQQTDQQTIRLTKEKHRLRGVLPISPTIIRVQTPSIQNYFGYN